MVGECYGVIALSSDAGPVPGAPARLRTWSRLAFLSNPASLCYTD